MNKIFTIILSSIAFNSVIAQTITSANFPNTGEIWVEFEDSTGSAVTITASGMGQTWDYSNSFTISDTSVISFRPTSDAPAYMNAATNFPGANLAVIDDIIDSSATFLKSNPSGFYYDGVYDEGTFNDSTLGVYISAIDYNPDRLIIPAPFSYNDTRDHNAKFEFNFTYSMPPITTQINISNYTIQNFNADATGTLTTPLGTFNNVLRVKEFTYQIDSTDYSLPLIPDTVNIHDTVITYSFLHANSHCLLMTAEVDPVTLQVIKASYYDPTVLVGDSYNNAIPVTMYPNPTTEEFYLNHIRTNSSIQIFDVSGKLIISESLANLESNIKVNTLDMPAGFYFFSISNVKDGNYFNGKFEVKK